MIAPKHTMSHSEPSDTNLIQTEVIVQGALDGLESQFADLQKQIASLQRLASLGTVCAMIAHEFNNLLTPIISYSQYALSRKDPALMEQSLERTLKGTTRLVNLSEKLLGLSAIERYAAGPVKVKQVILDALDCLGRDLAKDSIRLSLDVPDDLFVQADAGSLNQVLFNLFLNARQAMNGKHGSLLIVARQETDGGVAIDVTDTGPGIKPADLDQIFKPFFSTKQHEVRPERGGVGLGLHVAQRLILDMGGQINVRSRWGEGATFTILLPVAAG